MSSCIDSGQLLKNRRTGELGVSGLDPYGICGKDEVAITFDTDPDEPDARVGNGYPMKDWAIVSPDKITRYAKKKFGRMLH